MGAEKAVLIVDDEQGIRDMLTYQLKGQGYEIITAASGDEGIAKAREHGRVAVVLTDISMPGRDGISVLQEIKQINQDTEVIIMTGYSSMETAIQGLRAGAFDFVNKPFDINEIRMATRRAYQSFDLKQTVNMLNASLQEAYDEVEKANVSLEEKVAQRTEELALTGKKYRRIIDDSFDPIIILDDAGRITGWNRGAELSFGFTEAEMLGQPAATLSADDSLPLERLLAEGMRDKGYARNIVTLWRTRNGESASVNITASVLGGGEVSMIVRDITQEKKIDQMKTDFVSNVSHELRTPLTSIKGAVDLVLGGSEGPLTDPQREMLSIVRNNSLRLIRLISDLLDLSRIESGRVSMEMAPVDIGRVLKEISAELKPLADRKGITVTVEAGELPLEVVCDADKIKQVITNLLGNAIKFTPEQGTVGLSARPGEDGIVVSVSDTGIGVPATHYNRIFERFQQVDSSSTRAQGGTGLGLAIARSIVEAHRGRIWVESEINKGSVFSFLLPRKENAPAAPPATALPSVAPSDAAVPADRPFSVKRVLVVDDDADLARVIEMHLVRSGYEVLIANSGLEVVKQAIEFQPHLITMDVLMPQINGFTATELLKQNPHTRHIPVVIISVIQERERGFKLGVSDYIAKPFEPGELLSSIHKIERQVRNDMGRRRILLIDDDADIVTVLTSYVKEKDFQVFSAYDGLQGIALAKKEKPDIIMLDITLPEMDGFEVIRRLKEDPETAGIPVIVITGKAVEEGSRAVQLGANEYLIKPFSLHTLQDEIEKILGKN